MKILITGAKGFMGKNLVAELKNRKYADIFEYDIGADFTLFEKYCKEADFIFHLAGVNRPKEQSEYMEGNYGFTYTLLDTLKKYKNSCPIMMSSSIQFISKRVFHFKQALVVLLWRSHVFLDKL